MPANLLNLAAYAVTALQENEHGYHVDAVAIRDPVSCPHCHHDKLDNFGRRVQMVKDLPLHGKRVGIYIDTRRYRCKSCLKTFYETLPAINEKRFMTNRLVEWIGKQAIKRTFAGIAEEVGIVEGTVRLIFKDYVADLSQRIRFETPKWMGIDEIPLIRPRGVITNIQNNTVVELLPNRDKETLIRYLSNLEDRQKVQYVVMDMWRPYKDAVEAVMPHATIVIDKFRVVRMANDAMERIRKSYRESLTPKQRRGLMHDRVVMLKREHDLSDQEVLLLSGWIKNHPELGLAYRLKEDFYKIYDAKNKADALARFEAWDRTVRHEARDAFSELIEAWRNWQPGILAYFDHPVTNAYAGSLNSLIRVMNRPGRGYSFEALRAKILFAEGAFKTHMVKPKYGRRREPGFGIGLAAHEMAMKRPYASFQYRKPVAELNYGPEISTLAHMIENGRL